MKTFINDAINNGIKNYLLAKDNKEIDNVHIVEFYVVKILVMIYGEASILNPYKLNDPNAFINNLCLYNVKKKGVENLISNLNDYSKWLDSNDNQKYPYLVNIKRIIIEMALLKNSISKIDPLDYKYISDFVENKLKFMDKIDNKLTEDSNDILNLWNRKKIYFKNKKLKFKEYRPKLLEEKEYKEYGIMLKDLKSLSNDAIERINNKIVVENDKEQRIKSKFTIPLKVAITSGSGFIDTMVLLSVMATEIMIGLIIAFIVVR